MKFSVENIISFIFARNAQKVGFHGVKKYCAKKVALTGNLSKICAPISELQKSCPPPNLPPAINNEQSPMLQV